MKASELLAESELDKTLEHLSEYSFIITYPRHRYRRALLALALSELRRPAYYYPLQPHQRSLVKWLSDFINDAQFPNDFGHNTSQVLEQRGILVEELAEALASDLNALRKTSYSLILDNLDYLLYDKGLETFFRELAHYLPKHVQIIIDGYQLRRQPWHDLKVLGKAAILGGTEAVGGGLFHSDDPKRGQIEFYALSGHSRVMSDGKTINTWDGTLPRNLCYYFIEKEMVTRQQVFDVFWPHLGIKEATNVFHVTKRKISEKLGYDITRYSNGFYVPADDVDILYDAREFEHLIAETLENPDNTNPQNWYRAIQLYRHPYLEGLDMDWAIEKRQKLREGYIQALIGLGRYHWALKESEHALGYFQRAVAEQPNREDIHRNIMQIYYEAGQLDRVVSQYKMLESLLQREYDILPSRETRNLFATFVNSQ